MQKKKQKEAACMKITDNTINKLWIFGYQGCLDTNNKIWTEKIAHSSEWQWHSFDFGHLISKIKKYGAYKPKQIWFTNKHSFSGLPQPAKDGKRRRVETSVRTIHMNDSIIIRITKDVLKKIDHVINRINYRRIGVSLMWIESDSVSFFHDFSGVRWYILLFSIFNFIFQLARQPTVLPAKKFLYAKTGTVV